jgi:ADP-heptose:LPS heptosyltransferase
VKVLLLRYAAIGDCVISAWAATALREALPEAEVHWAIQPRCEGVVDERRLAQPRLVPRDKRQGTGSLLQMIRFWMELRQEKYDLGLDFQGHSKTALALRFSGAKKRLAGRAMDALAQKLNPLLEPPQELKHFVEREHWLVQQVLDCTLPERPLMPELEDERARWRAMGQFVSIQTGAGSPDKQYPPHYWQKVADELMTRGIPVVALGGKGDPEIQGAVNMAGKATLRETMGCVAESQVHLAADTGTGHIAAAYGVPLVSVFGPTNPDKYRPWGARGALLRKGKMASEIKPSEVAQEAVAWWREGA